MRILGSALLLFLVARGEFAEAVRLYREVLTLTPGNAIASLGLGHCLEATGEAGRAHEAYRQAVRSDPNLAMGWLRLALLEVARTRDSGREHLWRGLRLLTIAAQLESRATSGSTTSAAATAFARAQSARWAVAEGVARQGEPAVSLALLRNALELCPAGSGRQPVLTARVREAERLLAGSPGAAATVRPPAGH